ncbi:MAG: cyclic nucleotide-binding domain-containing protein [Candidatus Sericytochromatia bacterium]|nr:cyclic nucleotide-binding domain-containing protein [Candidatus Tanganyikabacteria bacterium]
MPASNRVEYPAGQVLFEQDDNSRDLYMLVTGAVEVIMNGQKLATINEGGAIFGEISFLLDTPRTATVRTTAPSEFLVITDVESLLETQPMLMARIAKLLASRLREMDEKFLALRRTLLGT